MSIKHYQGSCHCNAVRYEVNLDLSKGTNRCNCSLCWKSRAWFAITNDFKLLTPEDGMGSYQWIPTGKQASHLTYRFCKNCGVRIFATGEEDALGGKFYAVHIPTLNVSKDELAEAPMKINDMLHNRPDRIPTDTRFL